MFCKNKVKVDQFGLGPVVESLKRAGGSHLSGAVINLSSMCNNMEPRAHSHAIETSNDPDLMVIKWTLNQRLVKMLIYNCNE